MAEFKSDKICNVCGLIDEYDDENSSADHINTPKHVANLILECYKRNKSCFTSNRDGIIILCSAESFPIDDGKSMRIDKSDHQKIWIYVKPNEKVKFSFSIQNVLKDHNLVVVGIHLAHPQQQFVLNHNPYKFGGEPHILEKSK